MFDQLTELENITVRLERVTSLFNCMCRSYFETREPNGHDLLVFYSDYVNIMDTMRELVTTQADSLSDITGKLYVIGRELRNLAEQNMALLKGGVSA